jgi:hypothetical protein
MAILFVERLGGLAGFGSEGSRLRSRGHIDLSALAAAERDVIEALFASPIDTGQNGLRDAFRYRITRTTPRGEETIEARENVVPESLRACVRDEIA